MFKRRARSYTQTVADGIYPRGGWMRAFYYMFYRLRRLPDPPHRIARGVAIGVFVCFTPFYGLHFLLAGILVVFFRANLMAALISTFFGNPVTFPIIALVSVELGSRILGLPGGMPLPHIVGSFTHASIEIWSNLAALFSGRETDWSSLDSFYRFVFWPYLIGGIIPGIIVAAIFYMLSRPFLAAYQTRRIKKLKKQFEKRRQAALTRAQTRKRNQTPNGEKGNVVDGTD